MQFLLIAYDYTDAEALERRMRVREEHLKKIHLLKERGEFLFGGAILDSGDKMIGSMIVYDFPDRKSLDEILENEPYITGRAWEKIEIKPFRVPAIK